MSGRSSSGPPSLVSFDSYEEGLEQRLQEQQEILQQQQHQEQEQEQEQRQRTVAEQKLSEQQWQYLWETLLQKVSQAENRLVARRLLAAAAACSDRAGDDDDDSSGPQPIVDDDIDKLICMLGDLAFEEEGPTLSAAELTLADETVEEWAKQLELHN